jgi:heme/copper-type cytochrome/quinol oxidase subunit 4
MPRVRFRISTMTVAVAVAAVAMGFVRLIVFLHNLMGSSDSSLLDLAFVLFVVSIPVVPIFWLLTYLVYSWSWLWFGRKQSDECECRQ